MGQFLHADDLAEAVICVVKNNFDGPINVAPDGWMSSALLAELSGPVPQYGYRPLSPDSPHQ